MNLKGWPKALRFSPAWIILILGTIGVGAISGGVWALSEQVNPDGSIAMGVGDETGTPGQAVAAAPVAEAAPEDYANDSGLEPAQGPARLAGVRVGTEQDQPVVNLLMKQRARHTLHYLSQPERLLVKLYNTTKTWNRSYVDVNQSPLQRIRLAQHDEDVWVVLDLSESGKWAAQASNLGLTLRPAGAAGSAPAAAVAGTNQDPDKWAPMPKAASSAGPARGAAYQVVDVVVENLGEKTRLTVTTDGQARYKVERERNGRRLRLKFYSASLLWPGTSKPHSVGAIQRVSAQQLREGVEPVVVLNLDLVQENPYWVFKDQNQVLVEVTNPSAGASGKERGSLYSLVSVDLQNANFESVLRALAQEVGFDIVLTPNSKKIEGDQALVTMTINQQPFKNVLDFILRPRKLAYAVGGNTLRVGLASEFPTESRVYSLRNVEVRNSSLKESLESILTEGTNGKVVLEPAANRVVVSAIPSDLIRIEELIRGMDIAPRLLSQSFTLSYTQAEKILPVITPLLSSLGSAKVNEGENTLVVNDLPGNMNQIARLVRSLDTKSEQIMIEARIVEVSRSDEVDLGVRWNLRHRDASRNPAIRASSYPDYTDAVGQLSVGTVQSGMDINATLSALEEKGKVNTISNPRIATLNKQTASLKASQNIPYTTSMVSNGVVSTIVNYLELPITLTVVPQITKDRQVMLNPMTLIVTTVVGDGTPPPTTSRTASTQMVVSDGETIAIGGMVRDEEIHRESKVPILGDIPLLGLLFRGTETVKNKVELVVFLTTHILE